MRSMNRPLPPRQWPWPTSNRLPAVGVFQPLRGAHAHSLDVHVGHPGRRSLHVRCASSTNPPAADRCPDVACYRSALVGMGTPSLVERLRRQEARSGSDWTCSGPGADSRRQRRLGGGERLIVGFRQPRREDRESCGPGKTAESVSAVSFCQTAVVSAGRYQLYELQHTATASPIRTDGRLLCWGRF